MGDERTRPLDRLHAGSATTGLNRPLQNGQTSIDDDDRGLRDRWYHAPSLGGSIVVPFPPESSASGVHETGFHSLFWYHRVLTSDDLAQAGHTDGNRVILRFGAVDYRAIVWINGQQIGSHEGGHTPFSFDVTDLVDPTGTNDLVVRVHDDPNDVAQPRGKQDWREHPHVIWYHRTSGIWQPVWLESIPELAIDWIHWRSDLVSAQVNAKIGLSHHPVTSVAVDVELRYDDDVIARTVVHTTTQEVEVVLSLSRLTNEQEFEELLWSPEHPRLIDARITITQNETQVDVVSSYLGLRSATVDRRLFLVNDRPCYIRSVLNQGYWPHTHLSAPSADALRDEVELINSLGFNATRLHQKFEDPRFLYWADRLGLMVWSEAPATFTFSATAAQRTVREWLDVLHRDFSHPCIVTWVPLNESWGAQHIAHDERMLHFARSLVSLTKAFDVTRPVVSNDGWEQVDTDILAIHDYESGGDVMRARYRDRNAVDQLLGGVGPAGRRLVLRGDVTALPVMLTEFGGISYNVQHTEDAWGYSDAHTPAEFRERLTALMSAIHDSSALAGYCYTQLADTLQETNGLVDADRTPKLPIEELHEIMARPGRTRR